MARSRCGRRSRAIAPSASCSSIGTRGKPRTLQVPGENLPKVFSLLDDPDDWRGKNVLVVGGGDSACEAALALADAGARVTISYRGKGFNRAAPKNKSAIEAYAAEGRVKAKLGSQVLEFDHEAVMLALGDGSQKRYPNEGAFVLIGADPPVQWLEKMGIHFVQRPHQHQMGRTDDILRRLVTARAVECPEDAARAAAQVLGGSTGNEPRRRAPAVPRPKSWPAGLVIESEPVSGPRKWLRSATSIFSINEDRSGIHQLNKRPATSPVTGKRRLDSPMPLSEFAKGNRMATQHTGHGRRDSLTAGERTRILRMLRDEGGRIADEDSQVFVGVPPSKAYDFDLDDEAAPPPPPVLRPDVPAKPAVVVGLAQARRQKKPSGAPPVPPSSTRGPKRTQPPPPPQHVARPRAPLPKPFDEPTRSVAESELLAKAREAPAFEDLPTRLGGERLFDDGVIDDGLSTLVGESPPKFLNTSTIPDPREYDGDAEATRLSNINNINGGRSQNPNRGGGDERTRAVDIRNDRSMSDIDWDID